MAISKALVVSSLLLMVTFGSVVGQPGQAPGNSQRPSPSHSQHPPTPSTPGLLPPGLLFPPGLLPKECETSVLNIQKCLLDGFKFLPNLRFGDFIGGCCKIFADVKEHCWPKIFPWDALLPQLIRSYCSLFDGKFRTIAPVGSKQ